MTVRAKFKCQELKKVCGYGANGHETTHVRLTPVSDDANKTWTKYTPGGSIEMQIDNPDALDQFELGKFYFIDFTPAPATEAEEKA